MKDRHMAGATSQPACGQPTFLQLQQSLLATNDAPITCICAVGNDLYVGTSDGVLQAWSLPAAPSGDSEATSPTSRGTLEAELDLGGGGASSRPVTQLQALPSVGLLLCACGGEVSAVTLRGLRRVATLHRSRARRFHSDGGSPVAGLCVCAGASIVARYDLGAPPTMSWSRMLRHATSAVRLTTSYALLATTATVQLLAARSGTSVMTVRLPGDAAPWRSACFVESAAAGAWWLLPLGSSQSGEETAVQLVPSRLEARNVRLHWWWATDLSPRASPPPAGGLLHVGGSGVGGMVCLPLC